MYKCVFLCLTELYYSIEKKRNKIKKIINTFQLIRQIVLSVVKHCWLNIHTLLHKNIIYAVIKQICSRLNRLLTTLRCRSDLRRSLAVPSAFVGGSSCNSYAKQL